MTDGEFGVVGNTGGGWESCSKADRFRAAWADLVGVPILIGVLFAFLLTVFDVQEPYGTVTLVVANMVWLVFRDSVFSPSRLFLWRRVTSWVTLFLNVSVLVGLVTITIRLGFITFQRAVPTLGLVLVYAGISVFLAFSDKKGNFKLVSLDGKKVTVWQAVVRNILLGMPFALTTGYFCEFARAFLSSPTWRRILYLAVAFLTGLIGIFVVGAAENRFIAMVGVIVAVLVPVMFIACDRGTLHPGDRLGDRWAKTRVVNA